MPKTKFVVPGFPKWPGLIVVGDDVTVEQAQVINVRTLSLSFSSNDKAFERLLYDELNIPDFFGDSFQLRGTDEETLQKRRALTQRYFKALEAAQKRYGVLPLEYLRNDNVVSCYVGGPHGWCDWWGKIRCSSYNIGKWPSHEEVHKEWRLIAKAFPFLNLRCQLLNEETCTALERDARPLVEYVVSGGKVKAREPKEPLIANAVVEHVSNESFEHVLKERFSRSRLFGERGCTLAQFQQALRVTEDYVLRSRK